MNGWFREGCSCSNEALPMNGEYIIGEFQLCIFKLGVGIEVA
jgi:hypothetical protein